jgi:hypothetical protein
MAIGTGANFQIYQEQINGGLVETLTQNVNAFNAASRNAIRLVTRRSRGDYVQESFFQELGASLVSRRDTTSVAAATDIPLTQDEFISVKLNRKVGPVAQTLDAFKKVRESLRGEDGDETISFLIGQMVARRIQQDWLDSLLGSAVAALNNNAEVQATTPNAPLDTDHLVDLLNVYGDNADRIVIWVMHSSPYYQLVKNQISANIDGVSNFNVAQATPITLNRPVLITDSDELRVVGSPTGDDDYYILGLTENALVAEESEEPTVVGEVVTGLENLSVRMQGEHAFNVGLKGYGWDTAGGGANPTDAALETGSNWLVKSSSHKDTAGSIIQVKGIPSA